MKQETKETINWIKKQINLSGECLVAQPNEYWKEDYEKAMKFLDSLPQIESRLCQGGYIQDENGVPCCNNDEVIFSYFDDNIVNVPKKKGQLRWCPDYAQFIIITYNEREYIEYTFDNIIKFEKVK